MKQFKKLGLAFTDEFLKVARPQGNFKKRSLGEDWQSRLLPGYKSEELLEPVSSWRAIVLAALILITFFGLFLRLFHVQVVEGTKNRVLADTNRVQMKILHAPRGVIFDRNGKVLAENNPGFRLIEDFDQNELKFLLRNKKNSRFISREEALSLETKDDPLFHQLEIDSIRFYPFGEVLAHVLGYVGEITEEEVSDIKYKDYRVGDRVGRAGIEQQYEAVLKGKDGAEIIEVDASGKKLRTLRKIDPVAGKNIYLSLDIDLQKIVFESLKSEAVKNQACCGVVVAEDPQTGEVLTLVSLPSFDPNAFTDPKRSKEATLFFTDSNAPLFNRAISASYPPGSTFKITTSLAGLFSKKITAQTQFEDTGVMSLGPYTFANWFFTEYGKTDGMVDVVKALQRSNDIFFYKVGDLVGVDSLGEVAKKLGMGKKLGIDLPGEVDGTIPNNEWKKKNIGDVWYPGDTLHISIGQGFLLTTPLQILAQTAFIASNGVLIQPHLATRITDMQGREIKRFKYEPIVKDIFKKEDLALVQKGLELVPKEGGTAWPFFNFSIPTAGKTGTAEIGDPKGKTHAWYTAYAPVDDPKIVVTVLVEKGGQGSSVAASVAKEILTWYFNPDKTNLQSLESSQGISESAKNLRE